MPERGDAAGALDGIEAGGGALTLAAGGDVTGAELIAGDETA
jgi:hypothetical protein